MNKCECAGYNFKSIRRGDYFGAESSKQLVKHMIFNMLRVKTTAERSHAVEQVLQAKASRTITGQQADEIIKAMDSHKEET